MTKKIVIMVSIAVLFTGMLFSVQNTTQAAAIAPKPVVTLNQDKVSSAEHAQRDNTGREPYFEFSSHEDITSLAVGRIKGLQIFENYSDFNKDLNGAQPGEPIKVVSLDAKPDYYLVPLIKFNKYVGSAEIFITDGKAWFGYLASFAPVEKILPVSMDEAITILKNKKGLENVSDPTLVYKTSKISVDRKLPFWMFKLTDGTDIYVNQDGAIFDKVEELDIIG